MANLTLNIVEVKGVNFVTNELNEKIAVQMDLEVIYNQQEALEDLLDGIIAEARKDEKKVPLDSVLNKLKLSGQLK